MKDYINKTNTTLTSVGVGVDYTTVSHFRHAIVPNGIFPADKYMKR